MTVFQELTADEQQLLLRGLQAASMVVSAASPGRKEETASEGFAAAAYVLESRDAVIANVLLSSLIVALEQRIHAEVAFPDAVAAARTPGAEEAGLASLRAVAAFLDARCPPDEAAGVKAWLVEVARVTARAGREDQGFLGRGGVLVNDRERDALVAVAAALGLPA